MCKGRGGERCREGGRAGKEGARVRVGEGRVVVEEDARGGGGVGGGSEGARVTSPPPMEEAIEIILEAREY
jgi:hypothetical protein